MLNFGNLQILTFLVVCGPNLHILAKFRQTNGCWDIANFHSFMLVLCSSIIQMASKRMSFNSVRRMFWCNERTVETSYLDGSSRRILSIDKIFSPWLLAVDLPVKRLYIYDNRMNSVQFCTYDGLNCHQVLTVLQQVRILFSLACFFRTFCRFSPHYVSSPMKVIDSQKQSYLFWPTLCVGWRSGVAVRHWTCDQYVVGLIPNLGQVVHTYVHLRSSSITWYWSKDSDSLPPTAGDDLKLRADCL